MERGSATALHANRSGILNVIGRSFGVWLAGAGGLTPKLPDEPIEQRVAVMMERTAKSFRESLRLGLMLALERRPEEPSARRMFLSVRQEALRRTVATFAELFPADLLGDFDLLAAGTLGAAERLLARRPRSSR